MSDINNKTFKQICLNRYYNNITLFWLNVKYLAPIKCGSFNKFVQLMGTNGIKISASTPNNYLNCASHDKDIQLSYMLCIAEGLGEPFLHLFTINYELSVKVQGHDLPPKQEERGGASTGWTLDPDRAFRR